MKDPKVTTDQFKVPADTPISLGDYDPKFKGEFKNQKAAKKQLKDDIKLISDLQYQLFAENKRALLIIFQAMDAAGKDSAIKHVFSGLNPQGCEVHSFKQPSSNELKHDYLWRHYKALPERGKIGIFNRSHYENVLVTRVHPGFLLAENLPDIQSENEVTDSFWEERYRQINDFERTISNNGITIIKFFLHVSKEEQKKRFLARIENREKNWKFSSSDIRERMFWDKYQDAYEKAVSKTSTEWAPWYIIPADKKWFSRVAIGNIIAETMKKMQIRMPEISEDEANALQKAKEKLVKE